MIRTLSMAKAMKEKEQNPSIRIVDVRTLSEFREGHLPGAINIPLQDLRKFLVTIPDKNEKIFVYCAHGFRAAQAADGLFRMGYVDITNLGGIADYSGRIE